MAKETELFIFGVIGDYPWNQEQTDNRDLPFIRQLQQAEKSFDVIRIRINSPGGYVYDGMAIYNHIRKSTKEIHLYNDGLCASMAALLMFSVPLERRHLARNSLSMFHCSSTWGWGNAVSMREIADYLEQVDETGKECLRAEGVDEETITGFFDGKDHYLTARQMHDMQLGICEEFEAKAIPDVEGKSIQQIAAFYKPVKKTGLKDKFMGLFFNQSHKNNEVMSTKLKTLTFLAVALAASEIEMSEGKISLSMDEAINLDKKLGEMKALEDKLTALQKDKEAAEKRASDLQAEVTRLKGTVPGQGPTNPKAVTDPKTTDENSVVDMEAGHNQYAMEML